MLSVRRFAQMHKFHVVSQGGDEFLLGTFTSLGESVRFMRAIKFINCCVLIEWWESRQPCDPLDECEDDSE